MTIAKVAVSMPASTVKLAREQVKAGRAKSLSALVTQAVDEKLSRNTLLEILDAMDTELGKPGKEAQAWARRVLIARRENAVVLTSDPDDLQRLDSSLTLERV